MRENRGNMKILGIGFDNNDGETRLTRSENFHLVGGSEETHGQMQEKCIKFDEKLSQRGKKLGELETNELADLAEECEMNMLQPPKLSDK